MITVYGIRNCDTIKKTLDWLREEGLEYQLHDYRKQGISSKLIKQLLRHFTLEELINKRGTTWRRLPESQKLNLNESTASILMLENPSLIKRPILTDGNNWQLGFEPQSIADNFNIQKG